MPPTPSAAAKTTAARNAAATVAKNVQQALSGVIDPWAGIDVQIAHSGSKITLPEHPTPMPTAVAIETLQRKLEDDEQEIAILELVDAFPKDGAVAFSKAMQRMFGWSSSVPTPGFFGPTPPTTIDVEVGPNERIRVVWSRFELPGVSGFVACDHHSTPNGPRFVITGNCKRKDFGTIERLAELTRQIAAAESIYRNKAIALKVDDDGDVDWWDGISFTDLSRVNPAELVFSEITGIQIATSLWTPIEQTEACRQHQIPLKRGILMAGKYGTGKSLCSAVTAHKAVTNGWTFLSIGRVSALREALLFARKYQPCVVFAEDVDQVLEGEERTEAVNDILNEIDGISAKGTEIMVVLTTNHVEKINRAMIRPGRLDAVINVTPPDRPAVVRLIRLYGRELIAADDPLTKSSEQLDGQIPAMIRECTERAKLHAIQRTGGDAMTITDDDVYHAALGMKDHMELLEQEVAESRDPTFKELLAETVSATMVGLQTGTRTVDRRVRNVHELAVMIDGKLDKLANGAGDKF